MVARFRPELENHVQVSGSHLFLEMLKDLHGAVGHASRSGAQNHPPHLGLFCLIFFN
jgi:hypothetical protein